MTNLKNENAKLRRALRAAVKAMELMHDPSSIENDPTAKSVQKTIERCRTLLSSPSESTQPK